MCEKVKLLLCQELRTALAEFERLSSSADQNNPINKARWYAVRQDIFNLCRQLDNMEKDKP